jgi:NADH-quinone oxidoreductase subunit C
MFFIDPKYYLDLNADSVMFTNENQILITNFADIRQLEQVGPFTSLTDITAIDNGVGVTTKRFKLVYLMRNSQEPKRSLVWTQDVIDSEKTKTLSKAFGSALALEREVYDMFGLFFSEHPDLRRILTDYGFVGFPLRKDFPVTGYYEIINIRPDSSIQYERVSLDQDFRLFI